MRGSGSLGLGPFLGALEARLRALPAEQVRAALLTHGTRLRPREREPFLEIFPALGADSPILDPADPGEDLLSDIASFVERLSSGAYCQGWGWDEDIHDERAWGDESWVEEMDDLLDAAEAAFLGGNLDLARESYGRLLHTFLLDQDGEAFCGPTTPTEMVTTDVGEAKARYLRALYETVPPPDRTARLLEEMSALRDVGEPSNLRTIVEARHEPLDLEPFLSGWIEQLKSVPVTELGFVREAARLLAEAVELHRGVDGLGDLARESGRPEAFWDWVSGLERAGQHGRARLAAVEALQRIPPHGEVRARIAERLGILAAADGDGEAALSAWQQAWRASPSTPRLVALEASARAVGRVDEVIAEEADGLGTLWPATATNGDNPVWPPPAGDDRLAAAVLLLAGRVEEAALIGMEAEPLGWSRRDHPGPVVIPFLLIAGAGCGVPRERGSLLRQTWEAIDVDPVFSWGPHVDGRSDHESTDAGGDVADHGQMGPEGDRPRLSTLLARRIARVAPDTAEQMRWLDAGMGAVDARITAVLTHQDRGAYERVACLAVACAEALALGEDAQSGVFYLDQVRQRWSRYPAFRRELDAATNRSAITEPAPRPDRRRSSKR